MVVFKVVLRSLSSKSLKIFFPSQSRRMHIYSTQTSMKSKLHLSCSIKLIAVLHQADPTNASIILPAYCHNQSSNVYRHHHDMNETGRKVKKLDHQVQFMA